MNKMGFKTKLKLAGAFVYVMSVPAGIWPLVLLGTLVLVGYAALKVGGASDEAKSGAKTLAALSFSAPINFGALVG